MRFAALHLHHHRQHHGVNALPYGTTNRSHDNSVFLLGESHGTGVGVILDGCPPRIPLTTEDIQIELDRRKPGQVRAFCSLPQVPSS